MAEIEMERRPRRHVWTWVILILVIAAVAIGAWLAFGREIDVGGDAVLDRDLPEEVTQPLQEAPPAATPR